MANKVVWLFVLVCLFSCGQKKSVSSWKYIVINENTKYPIESEDSVVINGDTQINDTVRASLKVSAPYDCKIRFSQARFSADTLVIQLFEATEKCTNDFTITVVKGIYKVDYALSMSLDQITERPEQTVMEESSKVMLSTSKFSKGDEVKGYVSFKGWRHKNLGNEPVNVEGIFKVMVE
jgi:hypothetical protein